MNNEDLDRWAKAFDRHTAYTLAEILRVRRAWVTRDQLNKYERLLELTNEK